MSGRTDRVAGALLALLGVAVGAEASTFDVLFRTDPVGPKALPWLSAAIFVVAGVTLAARPRATRTWPDRPVLMRMLGAVAAFGLYAALLAPLGFVVATTLTVGTLSMLFGGPWRRSFAAALGLSATLWYLFVWVLGLSLPLGGAWTALLPDGEEVDVAARPAPASMSTPELQATSLLGEALYAKADTLGEIAEADRVLAATPDDVEALIAAGRARRNSWHYREAIALYTRAAELAPADWRPWRFRGHRHLSLREFPEGVADLERAHELAPLNWDVAYHLGLGYFLSARWDDAAATYLDCLALATDAPARAAQSASFRSCSQNGDDPDSRVAMTEWAVRALLRAGRGDEAAALVAAVPTDLQVGANLSYYHDLLYDKGLKTEQELTRLGPDAPYRLETVGLGVATRLLAAGDTTRADEIFRRIADDPWWPGFGRIAAEAELARRREGGR